jgi:hypothetical protein
MASDTQAEKAWSESPSNTPQTDKPQPIVIIDTGYKYLNSVVCLHEDQIWTRGDGDVMKLLDTQGKLLTSVKTKSGNTPQDLTLTREGDLVYTDHDKTVNLVKNNQIQTVITLQGWVPRHVCTTSSGDLLVIMDSDDHKQSKVVRYSEYTETQTIQFDGRDRPLYSPEPFVKYICENRNMDICVAMYIRSSVVVVNQSGKLRFSYTGPPSNTKDPFYPVGIATDSQSQIVISDMVNDCIHILDQDGQFLRYIQIGGLHRPFGLCVDIRDNLFVAECETAKVKKIQYL